MEIKVKGGDEVGEAIQIAYANASEAWKDAARNRVFWLARHNRFFTSDEVISFLDEKGIKTKNNSALGGVFRNAQSNGWIRFQGYRTSARVSRHGAPIRLWKSLLYVDEAAKKSCEVDG